MATLTQVQLLAAYRGKLASSGLTPKEGGKLALEPTPAVEMKKLGYKNYAAVRIPYFDPAGNLIDFERVRYLEDTRSPFDRVLNKKERRYDQLKGTGTQVYLPPLMKEQWGLILRDPSTPIDITEGELKAACATSRGMLTIGLGGVWNFLNPDDKGELLPMLEMALWEEREVRIVFDSDAATNINVVKAENRLAKYLHNRGAVISIVRLPSVYTDPEKKTGIDDYILVKGIDDYRTMMDECAEDYVVSRHLREFNEKVVFVRTEKTIVETDTMLRMNHHDFTRMNYAAYKYAAENKDGDTVMKPTAQAWLEWPHRRELIRSTYAPGADRIIGNELNTWVSWGCDPIPGDVIPWLELLEYIFSSDPNNGDLHKLWFERWLAFPLQHPGAKLHTAVVMVGPQGVGKTLVADIVAMIYGENAVSVSNRHFKTDHNTWAAQKQFVIGNEILAGHDSWEVTEALKEIITRDKVLINPKFVNEYSLPDTINYYITSNKPHAIHLEDDDRRYFVHRVPAKKRDDSFYAAIKLWKNNGGPSHLFDYLMNLDLGNFNPDAGAPGSTAKEEMKAHGRNIMADWVHTLKTEPDEVLTAGKTIKTWALWSTDELFGLFSAQRLENDNHKFSPQLLARELRTAGIVPAAFGMSCRVRDGQRKIWITRDVTKYEALSGAEIGELYDAERGPKVELKKRKF